METTIYNIEMGFNGGSCDGSTCRFVLSELKEGPSFGQRPFYQLYKFVKDGQGRVVEQKTITYKSRQSAYKSLFQSVGCYSVIGFVVKSILQEVL